jgi:uncharacterized protein YndB with AHSA1/START domain
MHFETTVEIDASPEAIWELLVDVEHWPEWTESMTRIERLDDGPLRVGSRARVKQPRTPAVVWEVTELATPRSFTWQSRSPGLRTVAGHETTAAPGRVRRSSVRLLVDQRGPLAALTGRLLGRRTQVMMEMEAAGLKIRSEE